ncbi:hypothetical protein AS189_03085 [Arthrobacter alpinus]|uniref:D-alanyl-D-alanine carboxypeptidase n=1 Tax=Arthrobacter alpinus TaxID=656366 RepID=A0A0S2LW39_9MICC|nr:D-alanyl-D-alanine carboxypeptidase/D-alanyl-D-alanine-endopeptidase [Arthrobacter alpinus]ALO65661.1 hypothetical protein AS189_03085 [Arthrobacter alpinus]
MGRTSKAVTSGLLICALAAVSVPAGLYLAPAFLPQDPAAVAVVPAAQLAPATISTLTGVNPLSKEAPLPDADQLSEELKKALMYDGEGTFSMYVTDVSSGTELFSQDGKMARIPASNLKLLTAAAALKTLGPDTRLRTEVRTGDSPQEIVLRGGGDAMLAAGESDPESVMGYAGLATLAKETAAALTKAKVKEPITLSVDDTLFTGPALNPKWAKGDVDAGEIAPIFPLALNAGRVEPGVLSGPRPQDSAMVAAQAFAEALADAGVTTTETISRASGTGATLAAVDSATVAQQTQYMLDESDNYVAEVMGRMVAVTLDREASNTSAVAAVRQVVEELGLPLDGVVTTDNSGLAEGNLISAERLAKMVTLLLADPTSNIGAALPGLPIAGLSGSLAQRFTAEPQLSGAGVVRAKTGSLNEVSALSGYVINSHGRLLAFSILGNGLTGGAAAARPVLDGAAAVLAES